ncbi:MAG: hypothetical protein K2U26_17250 [Cyclobacteriaceae bacterium]|nr:hypothetical protein [Cyclobacteriaceae bacterium]
MKKIKKAIRLFLLVILILLAAMGIGISGNVILTSREPYRDAEIRTEQVDKKENEEDGETDEART